MQELNLGKVDPDFEKAYKSRLELLIVNRLGVEATNLLPDAVSGEFAKLMESNPSSDKIFKFYQQHIPDLPEKIGAILHQIREEFVQKAQAVKQAGLQG